MGEMGQLYVEWDTLKGLDTFIESENINRMGTVKLEWEALTEMGQVLL